MTVAVDICNSALIKLGAERINDMADDTKLARLCTERYTPILKRVLRSHSWTFALKRALLSASPTTVEWDDGESFFALPIDCVKVVSINSIHDRYKIEGQYLVCLLDTVRLTYVSHVISEDMFDETFKEAFAAALAMDLCFAVTQSNNHKQMLEKEFDFWISQARSFNSQEISPDNFEFSQWELSRTSGIIIE